MVKGHSMILTIFVNPPMFLSMVTMMYFNGIFKKKSGVSSQMYNGIVLHDLNVGKFA